MRIRLLVWLLPCCLGLMLHLPVQAEEPAQAKPAPSKTFAVPYKLTDTQHVMVRVKINDKGPFNFILDTGAPALIMNEKAAEKIGLKGNDRGLTTFNKIELEGGLVIPQVKGLVLDMFQLKGMNSLGLAGVELHGVLGYTVLARYRIQYDFTSDKLLWTELNFQPPPIVGIGGKGGSQGGMEMIADMMKMLGPLLGIQPNFERKPRGLIGIEVTQKDDGIFITGVLKGSPADKAGLKVGDQLLVVGRRDIDTERDLQFALEKLTAGKTISIQVRRGDKKETFDLELGRGF